MATPWPTSGHLALTTLLVAFRSVTLATHPFHRLSHMPANFNCSCGNRCLTPTVQPRHELFGFGATHWKFFDWSQITTVAWPGDEGIGLVCEAHKYNARVISGSPPVLFTADKALRKQWIDALITSVQTRFLDGVTFDYEEPLSISSENRSYYVSLVKETTEAMHSAIPGSQVSVCVAWSPDDIDGRNYDYKGLADASDLLYVMAYDTRSQVFGRCIASANSPLSLAYRGMLRYLQLGVPAQKLVLGTPWYGYSYPCVNEVADDDDFCALPMVPFRGVNCSDAAGAEVQFMHIMNLLDRNVCPPGLGSKCEVIRTNPTPRWDASTQSPYFNYKADGKLRQMWFDNPQSSRLKYEAAMSLGLKGVGPFTWDDLDNDGSITGNPHAPEEAKAMWEALRVVTNPLLTTAL